jgi:hypothetical protein
MQTHTDTVPLCPAVLRAAREIGITDEKIADALNVHRAMVGHWAMQRRQMSPELAVALVTVVATLRQRLAQQQPSTDPKHAKIRSAALESAQRWLNVAAEEIETSVVVDADE